LRVPWARADRGQAKIESKRAWHKRARHKRARHKRAGHQRAGTEGEINY
jgi:hypothetical protein